MLTVASAQIKIKEKSQSESAITITCQPDEYHQISGFNALFSIKQNDMPRSQSLYTLILVLSFITLSSCDSHHFLLPQPVDKNNIEEFPRDFMGSWFDAEEGKDSYYLITRKNVAIITMDTIGIVSGAWPRITRSGERIDVPFSFMPFSSITYDSLKIPVDTSINYLVAGNLIYEMTGTGFLNKGYPFYTIADSIYYLQADTLFIDLGQNAFLRRLNKNFYVLNILNRVHGKWWADLKDWWLLVLLEKNDQRSFNVWGNSSKLEKLPCMIYPGDSSGLHYYNCAWTTDQLLRLMKDGYFELSTTMYRRKD